MPGPTRVEALPQKGRSDFHTAGAAMAGGSSMGMGQTDDSNTLVLIVGVGSEEGDGAKSAHRQRESIDHRRKADKYVGPQLTNEKPAPNKDTLQLN